MWKRDIWTLLVSILSLAVGSCWYGYNLGYLDGYREGIERRPAIVTPDLDPEEYTDILEA